MAANNNDNGPIDFNNYADFPSGVYLVWAEVSPHPPHPPLSLAKFCPGGCNGQWLQQMWELLMRLKTSKGLCYDSNTVHWNHVDGTVVHGLVIGPFFNQGQEKGDEAMDWVTAVLQSDPKYRWDEFTMAGLQN